MAWSPDGGLLALAGFHDHSLRLWDTATGQFRLLTGRLGGWDRAVAFSPNGKLLATAAADGAIQLWGMPEGKKLDALVGHAVHVICLAFSPDGTTLASGGADGSLRLWDTATGKGRELLKDLAGGVFGLSWSPKGDRLACGLTPDVQIVRIEDAKVVQVLEGGAGPTRVVCWSPGGETLITGEGWMEGKVQFWNTRNWKPKWTVPGHDQGVFAGAWSADGACFASGGADGDLRWWEANGQALMFHTVPSLQSIPSRGAAECHFWPGRTRTGPCALEEQNRRNRS